MLCGVVLDETTKLKAPSNNKCYINSNISGLCVRLLCIQIVVVYPYKDFPKFNLYTYKRNLGYITVFCKGCIYIKRSIYVAL